MPRAPKAHCDFPATQAPILLSKFSDSFGVQ
jgi:hypothetical protein